MTTQLRQPMRGTAKRPVKKAKSHQTNIFEAMSGKSEYSIDMFLPMAGYAGKGFIKQ